MALEKLRIFVETGPKRFAEHITVQFNPNQITIEKSVNWDEKPVAERDVPEFQFTHGQAANFSLDLFFDTYEDGIDVREHTDLVLSLTAVDVKIHRPPICQLVWGKLGVFFQGVLESVTQTFSLFLEDGTPVRATLGCTFKEWRSEEEDGKRQKKQSVDVAKTYTVRRGDTLSAIASDVYEDASLWRPIAEANGIENPRAPAPGQILVIPALSTRSVPQR